MSVSLYEQFLSVGSVRSLMTGKGFADSYDQTDTLNGQDKETTSSQQQQNQTKTGFSDDAESV